MSERRFRRKLPTFDALADSVRFSALPSVFVIPHDARIRYNEPSCASRAACRFAGTSCYAVECSPPPSLEEVTCSKPRDLFRHYEMLESRVSSTVP